jgi:hypothetical protein
VDAPPVRRAEPVGVVCARWTQTRESEIQTSGSSVLDSSAINAAVSGPGRTTTVGMMHRSPSPTRSATSPDAIVLSAGAAAAGVATTICTGAAAPLQPAALGVGPGTSDVAPAVKIRIPTTEIRTSDTPTAIQRTDQRRRPAPDTA